MTLWMDVWTHGCIEPNGWMIEEDIQKKWMIKLKSEWKPLNAAQLFLIASSEEKEAHPSGHVILNQDHSSLCRLS